MKIKFHKFIKLLLVLLLMEHSGLVFGDWDLLGESAISYIYIDYNTVRKVDGFYRATYLFDFKSPRSAMSGEYYSSSVYFSYFDCERESQKRIYIDFFEGRKREGRIIASLKNDSLWKNIPVGTAFRVVYDEVCAIRKAESMKK